MKTLQHQINDAVRTFTESIKRIVMVHATTTLGNMFGEATMAIAPPTGDTPTPAPPATPKPGVKRPARDIADMAERLNAYIIAHPGKRIEQIAAGMGLAKTTPLQLPIVKLLRARAITKTGDRRATRYYPAARDHSARAAALRKGKTYVVHTGTADRLPRLTVKATRAAARKRGR